MDPNLPSQAEYDSWGQAIGFDVDTTPSAMPLASTIRGTYVELRSPTDEDLEEWWKAFAQGRQTDSYWSYMLSGPYRGLTVNAAAIAASGEQDEEEEDESLREARAKASFLDDCKAMRSSPAHCYYAIVPLLDSTIPSADGGQKIQGTAQGAFSLFRPDLPNRCIELGHVMLAPRLRGTRAATEAFYLIMQRVFEGDANLGKQVDDEGGQKRLTTFRRLEWKCNNFNQPSKSAALRLGFSYEGLFRQHMISKARSRDTAWFSVIDGEWPLLRRAFQTWLDEENFETNAIGEARQKIGLREIRQRLNEEEEKR